MQWTAASKKKLLKCAIGLVVTTPLASLVPVEISGATESPSASGPAYQLAVTTQPPKSATVGSHFTVNISVEDENGAVLDTDSSTSVSLTISPGTGTSEAHLGCGTNPVVDTSGVAVFSCWIDTPGSGYQLEATAGVFLPALSETIDIASSTAARLAFTTEPPSKAKAGKWFSFLVSVATATGETALSSHALVKIAGKEGQDRQRRR